jgi:threonine/homoserine/homoserine lactone efflux protein
VGAGARLFCEVGGPAEYGAAQRRAARTEEKGHGGESRHLLDDCASCHVGEAPPPVRRGRFAAMNEAIGQVLSLGVGVAVSPVPIIAIVLMLSTPRARSNGPAFLIGWMVGLALAGTIVLVIAGAADASENGEPATWVSYLKVLLGLLLLLFVVRQWHSRDAQKDTPKWMQAIDTFTPVKAAGVAVVLAAVNPKNLLLTVAAATAIAQSDIDGSQEAIALAVFVVIGTLGVGAPLAVYFALGRRSAEVLERLKSWMSANNAAIMAVLLLVIGAKLVGDGISGF